MTRAASLTLIALGAILAFAVHVHPPFLNVQVAGWVIMATGGAGMLMPRSGYDAVRRRIVRKRYSRLNPASPSPAADDEADLRADRDQNDAETAERIEDIYIIAEPPGRG